MSDCRYNDDGTGCIAGIVLFFCLWTACDKIDEIEVKLDKLIDQQAKTTTVTVPNYLPPKQPPE